MVSAGCVPLQIAFPNNNKTPPLCKTRGRRGWVLMRQPSLPNASCSVPRHHTHTYTEREWASIFFVSVHFCFCVFSTLHDHPASPSPSSSSGSVAPLGYIRNTGFAYLETCAFMDSSSALALPLPN